MNSKGIDCLGDNGVCIPVSTRSVKVVKKQTRADVIRAMSDEELAEFLVDVETHGYYDQSVSGTLEMIEWLQSEAEQQKGAICGQEKCHTVTTE